MDIFKRAIDGNLTGLLEILYQQPSIVLEKDSEFHTPLHYAAWLNKADVVDALLQFGADSCALTDNNVTPLHLAARYKHRLTHDKFKSRFQIQSLKNIIGRLIEAKADVNARDAFGDTPLTYAVCRGNIVAVEELLKQPCIDVDSPDNRGWTTLHVAAKYNRLKLAPLLLDHGAVLDAKADNDRTPLHVAAMEGHEEVMQIFLNRHQDAKSYIEVTTVDHESALIFALENRKVECVKLCLQHGAQIDVTCRDEKISTLHVAALSGSAEICNVLLKIDQHLVNKRDINLSTPLHYAVMGDKVEAARELLKWGAEIGAKDVHGIRPIHAAVRAGSNNCLQLLLDKNAYVERLTKSDMSVLHIAAKENQIETLKILMEAIENQQLMYAMISEDDNKGNTPLHYAAEKGHCKVAELLLENGADSNNINEEEQLPLHLASKNGHLECVQAILKAAKNPLLVTVVDQDVENSLHLAAKNGHVENCKILLADGADFRLRNRKFRTPLSAASVKGHHKVVALLLRAGADIHTRDKMHYTPLHLAAKRGHLLVTNILLKNAASVSALSLDGLNPLNVAIKYAQPRIASAIIKSEHWKEAMRNRTPADRPGMIAETPLRQLIMKMPDRVEEVFDRCIKYPTGRNVRDPKLRLEFDFEFLDDTYTSACWGSPHLVEVKDNMGNVYNDDGGLNYDAVPYTHTSSIRYYQHPLTLLTMHSSKDLMYHPLVLALVKHKWRLATWAYLPFLFFYGFFVMLVTMIMVYFGTPPFMYNEMNPDNLLVNTTTIPDQCHDHLTQPNPDSYEYGRTLCLAAAEFLAVAGMIMEICQAICARRHYLYDHKNILDIFTYVSFLVAAWSSKPCDMWSDWQWQVGTASMFASWMNLILFLRHLPLFGMYVVMIVAVLFTFVKFFLFCFLLYCLAFMCVFYSLMRNQHSFSKLRYALMRTFVQTVGEFDFVDTSLTNEGFETEVFYEGIMFIMYLLFMSIVTIVVQNLMTGLAVGDVEAIQDDAKRKKLAMQIELSLLVEVSMPEVLRKKLHCVIGKKYLSPNERRSKFYIAVSKLIDGPLSAVSIASAILKEVEELKDLEDVHREKLKEEKTQQFQHDVRKEVKHNAKQLESVTAQLATLETKIDQIMRAIETREH